MIRNRLAELLAERQLKITKVAKDIGLSRKSVTNAVQNDSNMLRLETINAFCTYLKINPQQFFSYIPIDFEYSIQFTKTSIFKNEFSVITSSSVCDFDFFIDIKDHKNDERKDICMNGTIKFDDTTSYFMLSYGDLTLKYDTDSDKETFEHYQNMIEIAFYPIIRKDIKNYLTAQISKELSTKPNELELIFSVPKNFLDNDFIN